MARYVYLCPKCAQERHRFKIVHFPHGFGIKEVFIDGKKKAELVLLSPSQKRKCADCGKWIRHAYRIRR